ncbi:MAG TPA: hypothetical protein DCR24_01415 [Bacillus bacterium]|nr:hypothetical protein [Bacillus sp. (in: firmicutes)]
MTYIIENAHVLKGQVLSQTSMLVEGNQIIASKPSFNMYKHIRMNVDSFIMTPTHVLFDSNLPLTRSFLERKDHYVKNFILRGCTCVLTTIKINFEKDLEASLKQAKSNLMDSPIDYVIGVSILPALLTPAFIRQCKRVKVPAVFVEIKNMKELNGIPWGWVREALFPFNSPLIPVFKGNLTKKEKAAMTSSWNELMKQEKIPAVYGEIEESRPLPRKILNKTGIFPQKANLHSRGELSYNLYRKSAETNELDEYGLFSTQYENLVVTVDKGRVLRAGNEVYYRPGKGENVIIKTPGYFTDNY